MKAGELHELRERFRVQMLDVPIGAFAPGKSAPMSRDHATHFECTPERAIDGQMSACATITCSPL